MARVRPSKHADSYVAAVWCILREYRNDGIQAIARCHADSFVIEPIDLRTPPRRWNSRTLGLLYLAAHLFQGVGFDLSLTRRKGQHRGRYLLYISFDRSLAGLRLPSGETQKFSENGHPLDLFLNLDGDLAC
jgi:hypothetical protein